MSKVTVTMCDGCRKEITNNPFGPNLALVLHHPATKITAHYCYDCVTPILNAVAQIAEKQKNND